MAKIGRNEPCPCGSGKKYKKCCLAKDEQERQLAVVAAPEASEAPAVASGAVSPPPAACRPARPAAPPPDPHADAVYARWEAFEAADYPGQIALFYQTLDEAELMDDENAFEMLNTLKSATVEHGERDRFDDFVEALRTRLPAIYALNAHDYLEWQIINALGTGRLEAVSAWVRELVTTANHDLATLNHVIDALAYHGHLSLIIDAIRLAWPWVNNREDRTSWGIVELSAPVTHFVLLQYALQTADANPKDPVLVEQIEYYHPHDPEGSQQFLAHLTGRADPVWSLDDFAFEPNRARRRSNYDPFDDEADEPWDPARCNLWALSVEFLGYVYREEGVPYSKGELARQQIVAYLVQRFDGAFEEQAPMAPLFRPKNKKRRRTPKLKNPDHVLCPDRRTLNQFLSPLRGVFDPRWYPLGAALELLPAWLRFLERRGLIDTEQLAKTRQAIEATLPSLRCMREDRSEDPSFKRNLQTCWGVNVEAGSP